MVSLRRVDVHSDRLVVAIVGGHNLFYSVYFDSIWRQNVSKRNSIKEYEGNDNDTGIVITFTLIYTLNIAR